MANATAFSAEKAGHAARMLAGKNIVCDNLCRRGGELG
jgi:uncharacterized protein YsxB (DUF464 family)